MRSLTAVLTAALVLLPAAPAWAANQPPVVVDDALDLPSHAGLPLPVPALANDSDADGDTLTVTAVSTASKGRPEIVRGALYYYAYFGNEGADSFTYTVSDGQGNTATGTVTVTLWLDPAAPAGLTINSSASDPVILTWSAAARAADYRIYRRGVLVASTSGSTWTDNGPWSGSVQYEYRVAAVNGGGWEGPQSSPVFRQPQLPTPTGLTVDVTDDPTTLSVTWDGSGTGPWNVYRDGTPLTSTTVPSLRDSGLVTGREYSYQVQKTVPPTTISVSPASLLSPAVRGTPAELTPIGQLFWDLGWKAGDLGAITVPERAVPGGRQQDHARGIIVQQDGEAPITVRSTFAAAYTAADGAAGDLGFPLVEQDCSLRDHGCGQFFEGGSIWYQQNTGTHVVRQGVIEDGWAESGWEEGPLGYPRGEQGALPGGLWQAFEDGGVYWSAPSGSHAVSGEMHDVYTAQGGTAGPLGYPTTGANCVLRDGGCWQAFQGGYIHWSPATGPQVITGGILATWERQGWENGVLGYPTTGATCNLRGGGCWQAFQGGYIHWSPATGAQMTTGGILAAWERQGWENGVLGYPTTGANCGLRGGGCWQAFQGGYIFWSPATGAQVITGEILAAWERQGWQNGRLGYPTAGAMIWPGMAQQTFQGGSITVDTRGVRVTYR